MFDDKLCLRKEMKPSFLIQRLNKPSHLTIKGKRIDNPFSFGGGLINGGFSKAAMDLLWDIFSFDYMGAAEFEWGAVPDTLRFLAEQAKNKNLVTGEVECREGEKVYYIAPKPYELEVRKRIRQLREDDSRLKEFCGLDRFFEHTGKNGIYVSVGWLELDNGFAFFVDKGMFDKIVHLIIESKKSGVV